MKTIEGKKLVGSEERGDMENVVGVGGLLEKP
jgi:hypothetical protein